MQAPKCPGARLRCGVWWRAVYHTRIIDTYKLNPNHANINLSIVNRDHGPTVVRSLSSETDWYFELQTQLQRLDAKRIF